MRFSIKHVDPCTGSLASPLLAQSPSSSSTFKTVRELVFTTSAFCQHAKPTLLGRVPTKKGSARSRFEPLHRYWCYRFNGQIPISKHQTDNSHVPQGHSHVPPWQFWHAGAPVRPARTCNTRPSVLMAEQCAGGQAGTISICICSPAPSAGAGAAFDTLPPRTAPVCATVRWRARRDIHANAMLPCSLSLP
jgi:hypothetical protein